MTEPDNDANPRRITLSQVGINRYRIDIPQHYSLIISPFALDNHFLVYCHRGVMDNPFSSENRGGYFDILGVAHKEDLDSRTYEIARALADSATAELNEPIRRGFFLHDTVEVEKKRGLEARAEEGGNHNDK